MLYRAFNLKITSFNFLCTMAEIVADIAIHRRISCYSVGLKMLCLVGVNLEDLVGNYPLCTMVPIYLLLGKLELAVGRFHAYGHISSCKVQFFFPDILMLLYYKVY